MVLSLSLDGGLVYPYFNGVGHAPQRTEWLVINTQVLLVDPCTIWSEFHATREGINVNGLVKQPVYLELLTRLFTTVIYLSFLRIPATFNWSIPTISLIPEDWIPLNFSFFQRLRHQDCVCVKWKFPVTSCPLFWSSDLVFPYPSVEDSSLPGVCSRVAFGMSCYLRTWRIHRSCELGRGTRLSDPKAKNDDAVSR